MTLSLPQSSMDCYICGNKFDWSAAADIRPKRPAAAAGEGEPAAEGESQEEEEEEEEEESPVVARYRVKLEDVQSRLLLCTR